MSFTKNQAVIMTIISTLLVIFGFQTEGFISFLMCCVGSFLMGVTLMADQATEHDQVPDNLKD